MVVYEFGKDKRVCSFMKEQAFLVLTVVWKVKQLSNTTKYASVDLVAIEISGIGLCDCQQNLTVFNTYNSNDDSDSDTQ